MKKNAHNWIILFLTLIIACTFTVFGINNLLFYLSEEPMYSNIYKMDDLEISMLLPEGWSFFADESAIGVSNIEKSEYLYITEVESAKNMDLAKTMFKLSFESSHEKNIEYKEGTIEGSTEIYYVTYNQYSDFYVAGVIGNNGIYSNFTYVTKISNNSMSPLTKMLSSVKFNRIETPTETSEVPNEN